MYEFLGKLEDFLFDILGLALPGAIFLLILVSPIWFVHLNAAKPEDLQNLFLSLIHFFYKVIQIHWEKNMQLTIITFLISSYLLGHAIKILSIYLYEILGSIFDKIIIEYSRQFVNWLKLKLKKNKIISAIKTQKNIVDSAKRILKIPMTLFTYFPPDYDPANAAIFESCSEYVADKTKVKGIKWYTLFRISSVIINQEKIKSLSNGYLAKYNLYRSLALIFLSTAFYYHLVFKSAEKFLIPDVQRIEPLIIIISLFLCFTFHSKYLRYWTLCGNEALISLFYFLNKKGLTS